MRTLIDGTSARAMLLFAVGTLSTSPALAYPPDNAAVLYYKAFMLYEADDAIKGALDDYRGGQIELNEEIEKYLAKNKVVIDTVLDASRIDHCDWGLDYSQGTEVVLPPHNKAREIFFLVAAEAAMQADRGNYRTALERCVSMYRMAKHLNERPLICYLVGTAVTAATHKSVVHFLSEMPPDLETLTWFRDELAALDEHPFSVCPSLDWKQEAGVLSMSPERIGGVVQAGLDDGELKTKALERVRKADPPFYARNIAYWNDFLGRIQAAFQMPYEAARAELQQLDKQPWNDFDKNPDATLTACLAPTFANIHRLSVRLQANSSMVRIAVDLYLSQVQTGRLPEVLPENAPADPFTGKPFEYEKTADGFLLRYHDKEGSEKTAGRQYEFKIKG